MTSLPNHPFLTLTFFVCVILDNYIIYIVFSKLFYNPPFTMFGIHDFGVFLATGIVLNLTPGQDTFYILGRSIAQGRSAGVASVLGISTGGLVHTFAAALGLSALLAASASAFFAIKLIGAAYLVFLGARMLLSSTSAAAIPSGFASAGFLAVCRQGLLTNVFNPKVAIFFLAFMPQFIAADSPNKFLAFITLGLCFVTTGTIWCFCLVWFASLLGDRFRDNTTFADFLNRTAGALFIFLGARLATTK
jgi:threonine/homoserine/homoserine lactone efflux protein